MRIEGIAKLYLNGKKILEQKNAWTDDGAFRIQSLLIGYQAVDKAKATLHHVNFRYSETFETTTDEKGPEEATSNVLYYKGHYVPTSNIVVTYADLMARINASEFTLSTTSFPPQIVVPAGWTLSIEWESTISGEDYTSDCLNSIAWHLNKSTINTDFAPNTMGLVCSEGTVKEVISNLTSETANGKRVAVYTSSFGTGITATNIGTVQIYRNNILYSSKTIDPFTKTSAVELIVKDRNTIVI